MACPVALRHEHLLSPQPHAPLGGLVDTTLGCWADFLGTLPTSAKLQGWIETIWALRGVVACEPQAGD